MNPLGLVIITSTLARSGPINVVLGILRHIRRDTFCPLVVTLSPEESSSCIQEVLNLGIEVRQLNLSRVNSLLSGSRTISRMLNSVDAHVIHSHGFRADHLLSKAPHAGFGMVSTLHSELKEDYHLAYGSIQGAIMASTQYRALRKFNSVVSVSSYVAESAKRSRISSIVIPNGVCLDQYYPAKSYSQKKEIRRKLSLPEDATIFLHSGVLIERKNPLPIIRAFRTLLSSKNCLLLFAGDGPLKRKCEAEAQGADNIIFLGKRDDVADILRSASFVVSNSRSEGLPMALLEACASGTRIIASDIIPHSEIYRLFPHEVVLFPESNDAALGKRMEDAYAYDIGNRNANNFEPEAINCISDRVMSLSYQNLYMQIAKKSFSRR